MQTSSIVVTVIKSCATNARLLQRKYKPVISLTYQTGQLLVYVLQIHQQCSSHMNISFLSKLLSGYYPNVDQGLVYISVELFQWQLYNSVFFDVKIDIF